MHCVLPLVWTWITRTIRLTLCVFGSTFSDVAHCSFKGIREGTRRPSGWGANVWKSFRLDIFQGLSTVSTFGRANMFLADWYFHAAPRYKLNLHLKIYYNSCGVKACKDQLNLNCVLLCFWQFSSQWLEFGLDAVGSFQPRQNLDLSLLCCCCCCCLYCLQQLGTGC